MAKKRYSAAQRKAYWVGVGSALKENENGVAYSDIRRSVINHDDNLIKSFCAGRSRALYANKPSELNLIGRKNNRPK